MALCTHPSPALSSTSYNVLVLVGPYAMRLGAMPKVIQTSIIRSIKIIHYTRRFIVFYKFKNETQNHEPNQRQNGKRASRAARRDRRVPYFNVIPCPRNREIRNFAYKTANTTYYEIEKYSVRMRTRSEVWCVQGGRSGSTVTASKYKIEVCCRPYRVSVDSAVRRDLRGG